MATKDTLNALVQKVGLNKAVKLLGVKGVGKATYQKLANGEITPSRSIAAKASFANRLAEQQIQLRNNKELAKRIGFEKVLKRVNQKVPTQNSSLKEIEQFNRVLSNRMISAPSVFRLTGLSQNKLRKLVDKYSIVPSSIRFEERRISGVTVNGDKMYLVYLEVPKRKGREKDWYFSAPENIDQYKAFKQRQADALYNIWEHEDVFLHEFATDARGA